MTDVPEHYSTSDKIEDNLDRRLNAYRADLADGALEGQVVATQFVEAQRARVIAPLANLAQRPDPSSPLDSQLIRGEPVAVFEAHNGWSWVQSGWDGYVGYVQSDALGPMGLAPTHRISALTTNIYADADLKSPVIDQLSIGSVVTLLGETETRGVLYGSLDGGGYVAVRHVIPVDQFAQDYVKIAERFLHVPYLWAGRSGFGIDCSGIVQLSMAMAGQSILRDSDMQAETVGEAIDDASLQRGDLVFWDGHVGIMQNDTSLLHANANSMDTCTEPLDAAIERIKRLYGAPTGFRRMAAYVDMDRDT